MVNISSELAMIINLANASKHHKQYCQDADCNVSLYQLRQAAEFIARYIELTRTISPEVYEAKKIVEGMDIT